MLYDGVISHILDDFSILFRRYTFKIRVFDTQYIPIERQLLRKEYDFLLSRSIQEWYWHPKIPTDAPKTTWFE